MAIAECFNFTYMCTSRSLAQTLTESTHTRLPDDVNCDMSKQLLRFFNAAINGFECTSPTAPFVGDDTDGGRDDAGVDCVALTQSPSIALEALRLKCSKKLSICTSIDFGVFAIATTTSSTRPIILICIFSQHTWCFVPFVN